MLTLLTRPPFKILQNTLVATSAAAACELKDHTRRIDDTLRVWTGLVWRGRAGERRMRSIDLTQHVGSWTRDLT